MSERTQSSDTPDESEGFSADERAAMKERASELKTAARRRTRATKAEVEAEVLAKIAEMPEPDRSMAERVHSVIMSSTPELEPRLWYGMPAYAKAGKVVCFFQNAAKFKTRYSTLGFNDPAQLDDGAMWPTAYALLDVNDAVARAIGDLVKRAVG